MLAAPVLEEPAERPARAFLASIGHQIDATVDVGDFAGRCVESANGESLTRRSARGAAAVDAREVQRVPVRDVTVAPHERSHAVIRVVTGIRFGRHQRHAVGARVIRLVDRMAASADF